MSAADQSRSSFPQWVAWISLIAAVVLFFGNTVPGVREREGLRQASAELRDLRARYDRALEFTRPGTPGATGEREDLQTLLVAIDRLGWTPQELLAQYPAPSEPQVGEPQAGESQAGDSQAGARTGSSDDTAIAERSEGRPGNR
jgi:hypothetical protein